MLPSRYAKEHFRIPRPVGLFIQSHDFPALALAFVIAVKRAPVFVCGRQWERGSRGSSSEELQESTRDGVGPSKKVFRRVTWRLTRSPVPGRMKVAFLSLYGIVQLIVMIWVIGYHL